MGREGGPGRPALDFPAPGRTGGAVGHGAVPGTLGVAGESQGWGSLVSYRLWGCAELDTTEAT